MSEINEKMKQLVIAGDSETLGNVIRQALDAGSMANGILDEALLSAMDIVGQRMKSGEMFIPEVLLAARTMQSGLESLHRFWLKAKCQMPALACWVQWRAICTILERTWSA